MVALNVAEIQKYMPLWDAIVKAHSGSPRPTNKQLLAVFEEVQYLKKESGETDFVELLKDFCYIESLKIDAELWPGEP